MGSEDCLKLWMEAEAHCNEREIVNNVVYEDRYPVADEPLSLDNYQESLAGDNEEGRDDWSHAGALTLLEAYEGRLSERNVGNLKAKDWDAVASEVNYDCGEKIDAKSVKQIKRKLYSLRRWYFSVRSKQSTYRPDEFEESLLCILDRIMTPYPCQVGIPGGIDAGERMSTVTAYLFDENDEEGLSDVTAAVGTKQGRSLKAKTSCTQLGKRIRTLATADAEFAQHTSTTNEPSSGANLKNNPLKIRGGTSQRNEVAKALSGFAKVLTQVEQAKMEIMKDLDARRTELQLKLADFKPYPRTKSRKIFMKAGPGHPMVKIRDEISQ